MRHDQTDPGRTASRPDGRSREMSDRQRAGDAQIVESAEAAELADMAEMADMQDGGAGLRAGSQGEGGATGSWQDIKGRFVDDPAGALSAAEQLVRQAVEDRVREIEDEAAAICAPQRYGDASSTEALRTRLLRCQEYCERLARSGLH